MMKTITPITNPDQLREAIARCRAAQAEFSTFTQEQVDRIFLAAASGQHQTKQHNKACRSHCIFKSCRDLLAEELEPHGIDAQKQDLAAVQTGNGQQIDKSQVDADISHEVPHGGEGHPGHFADLVGDAHGTHHILGTDLSGQHHFDAQHGRLQIRHRIFEGIADLTEKGQRLGSQIEAVQQSFSSVRIRRSARVKASAIALRSRSGLSPTTD